MPTDSCGSLSRVFLGAGLGILAISCLTATVFFGMFADKYDNSAVQRLLLQNPYGYIPTIYIQSLIITACGGVSSFFAVMSIIFSIPYSNKILLMIILGGISTLFGLGCTVTQGIFTLQAKKYCSWNLYDETNNNYYDYPYGYQIFLKNKDAQEYIKKSIKELYSHGYKLLQEYARNNQYYSTLYEDFVVKKDVLNWSSVENYIGKTVNNHVITYRNFWASSYNEYNDKYKYIYLTLNSDGIYAHYSRQYYADVRIAATQFSYTDSFSRKLRFCWYKSDGLSLECKIYETGDTDFTSTCEISNVFSLNEYLIDGPYYSKNEAEEEGITVDYYIQNFPIAYRLLNYTESQDYMVSSFEDSTNHYRISGKQCAKAYSSDTKRFRPDKYSDFYLSPEKLNNVGDLIRVCIEPEAETCPYTQFGEVVNDIQSKYENSNRGDYAPFVKKYYDGHSRTVLFTIWEDPFTLYTLAIINIIAQSLGIIIWIVGRILGFFFDIEKEDNSEEERANSIMNNQLFGSLA